MNPFKLYRRQKEAQLRWIRNHPFQYIALNAILIVVWIWYLERKDPLFRQIADEEETPQQD